MKDEYIKNLKKRFSSLLNYEDLDEEIDPLKYKDPEGDTLLHYASLRGDIEAVRMLCFLNIDVNALGDLNHTALHYAAKFNHEKVYNYLISQGASPNLRSNLGKTPQEIKDKR